MYFTMDAALWADAIQNRRSGESSTGRLSVDGINTGLGWVKRHLIFFFLSTRRSNKGFHKEFLRKVFDDPSSERFSGPVIVDTVIRSES